MRDDREQQKPKSAEPAEEGELALDKETLKDLDPGASRDRHVKGGRIANDSLANTCGCAEIR